MTHKVNNKQIQLNITHHNNTNIIANKSLINIFFINIRSLKYKLDELKTYIHNSKIKFDVIVVAETWLCKNDSGMFNIDGYNAFHNERKSRDGGGVSIWTNNRLLCNVLFEWDDNWNNFLLIEIKKINIKILGIYL